MLRCRKLFWRRLSERMVHNTGIPGLVLVLAGRFISISGRRLVSDPGKERLVGTSCRFR